MKTQIFSELTHWLQSLQLDIVSQDQTRPWGGFFVINEAHTEAFIETFFPELSLSEVQITQKLSPKILVVGPHKRLSWQYHHRRAELWKVVRGTTVGVARSQTDEQTPVDTYQTGDVITLAQGERHRLVGLDDWGIVAEIWQHTNPESPSDESDIVRLQDDFGR